MIGVGSTVGNYQVVKKLGSGAMGSVYLAEHPMIGKRVALKVIHADLADNEEMVSRFFNEARAVTQIGHQNIVEVIDFGQSPEGDNFIVMELLEGRSLGDLIKESPILDVGRAQHIAIQIADGLEASHQRGIIHRDLKPDNVFLIPRLGDPDFVKILDFGLAKLTQGGGALSHKTRAGSVLGTPHYMAPEQCEGKPDIDHRVDVYALGCIMYQMLCGRVPFPGEGFGEVLVKHLREPPALPTKLNPTIPRPIEAIILHALAKRKEFRFQSMKEVARALRDPARHERELAGETSLNATVEAPVPPLPPRPGTNGSPPPRHGGPVAKAADEAPTMLDQQLPEAVRLATMAGLHGGGGGTGNAATMLLDTNAPIAPVARTAIAPTPQFTDDIPILDEQALQPARSRTALWVALAAGTVVFLVVGGVIASRLGKNERTNPDPTKTVKVVAPAGPRAVIVESDPPGAEVLQDGNSLGIAPVTLRFKPGDPAARVTLHLDGYGDVQRTISEDDAGAPLKIRMPAAAAPTPENPPAQVEPPKPVKVTPPGTEPRKKGGKVKKKPDTGDDILVPDF